MVLLKTYSIVVLVIIEAMMMYKAYTKMNNKEEYKYDLIAFFIMLPILYLVLSYEI